MSSDEQAPDQRDELVGPVLGLLDGCSTSGVKRLLARKVTTPTTTFVVKDVYAVLDAVEAIYPGLLNRYATIRTEGDR